MEVCVSKEHVLQGSFCPNYSCKHKFWFCLFTNRPIYEPVSDFTLTHDNNKICAFFLTWISFIPFGSISAVTPGYPVVSWVARYSRVSTHATRILSRNFLLCSMDHHHQEEEEKTPGKGHDLHTRVRPIYNQNLQLFCSPLGSRGRKCAENLRIWSCSSYAGYLFKLYLLHITYFVLCI